MPSALKEESIVRFSAWVVVAGAPCYLCRGGYNFPLHEGTQESSGARGGGEGLVVLTNIGPVSQWWCPWDPHHLTALPSNAGSSSNLPQQWAHSHLPHPIIETPFVLSSLHDFFPEGCSISTSFAALWSKFCQFFHTYSPVPWAQRDYQLSITSHCPFKANTYVLFSIGFLPWGTHYLATPTHPPS